MQVYNYFGQPCWSIWSLPPAAALTHHFPARGECCAVGSSNPDPRDDTGRGPKGGFARGALEDTPRSDLLLTARARWSWGQVQAGVEASSGVEAVGRVCGGASGRCGEKKAKTKQNKENRLFPWPATRGRRLQINCQRGKTVSVLKSKLQRQSLYLMLQTP